MRTRYTIATSWLVLLLCTFFVLNSGTVRLQASPAEDLKSVLSIANAAVGQPTQGDKIWNRMNATASNNAAVTTSPATISTARSNIDRYIEVATAIDPKLGDILADLCSEQGQDPVELERLIRRYGRNLVTLAELKRTDPGFYAQKINELNLDAEVGRLARQLVALEQEMGSDSPEVASTRAHLELLMRARLNLSIRNRERSIQRLEDHVDQLRERVEHDELNFDLEVDRQLKQLRGELDAVQAARGR